MNEGYVASSPRLLRLVLRAMVAWLGVLLVATVWLPAPLERAADPAHAPNPARAAWFLVWIQELVSHGTWWMYPVLALAIALVALPWLRRTHIERARWFRPGERLLGGLVAGLVLAMLVLMVIGFYFRGEQWQLVSPF